MNAGYQTVRNRILVAVLSLLMVFGNVASPLAGAFYVYADDNGDGTWEVNVWGDDGDNHDSLEYALNWAKSGTTIVITKPLIADRTLNVDSGKEFTIKGDSANTTIYRSAGTFVGKNEDGVETEAFFNVKEGGKLTLGENIILSGKTSESSQHCDEVVTGYQITFLDGKGNGAKDTPYVYSVDSNKKADKLIKMGDTDITEDRSAAEDKNRKKTLNDSDAPEPGATFAGWRLPDGDIAKDGIIPFDKINSSMTVVAVWNKLDESKLEKSRGIKTNGTYMVTADDNTVVKFNDKEVIPSAQNANSEYVVYGSEKLPYELPEEGKDGYKKGFTWVAIQTSGEYSGNYVTGGFNSKDDRALVEGTDYNFEEKSTNIADINYNPQWHWVIKDGLLVNKRDNNLFLFVDENGNASIKDIRSSEFYTDVSQDKEKAKVEEPIGERNCVNENGEPACFKYTPDTFTSGTAGNERAFFAQVRGGTLNIEGAILENFVTDKDKEGNSIKYAAPVVVDGGKFNFKSGYIRNNSVGYTAENSVSGKAANEIGLEAEINNYDEQYGTYLHKWENTETAGAVILHNGADATLSGGVIDQNRGDTGAIVVQGLPDKGASTENANEKGIKTKLRITKGTINNNVGVHHAGAIYIFNGGAVEMGTGTTKNQDNEKIQLTNNFAWNKGGAIWASEEAYASARFKRSPTDPGDPNTPVGDATFLMWEGTIDGNMAVERGGGIEVMSNHVALMGGKITGNGSRVLGGGIYVEGDPGKMYQLYIGNGGVTDNHAVNPAGSSDSAEKLRRTFNTAKSDPEDSCSFENNIIEGNTTHTSGDVGYANGFWGSYGNGGGIWLCAFGGNVTLSTDDGSNDVVITDNHKENPVDGQDIGHGKDIYATTQGQGGNGVLVLNEGRNNFQVENTKAGLETGHSYAGSLWLEEMDHPKQNGGVTISGNFASNGGGIAANGTILFGKEAEAYRATTTLRIKKDWADGVKEHDVRLRLQLTKDGTDLYVDGKNPLAAYEVLLNGKADTFTPNPAVDGNGNAVLTDDQYGPNDVAYEAEPYIAEMALPLTVIDAKGFTYSVVKFELPKGTTLADGTVLDKDTTLDPALSEDLKKIYKELEKSDKIWDNAKLNVNVRIAEIVNGEEVAPAETVPFAVDGSTTKLIDKKTSVYTDVDGNKVGAYTVYTMNLGFTYGIKNVGEEEPQVEKYVNNKVHQTLDNFDEVFEYSVMAYVPQNATEITIKDTLEDSLMFVQYDGETTQFVDENGQDKKNSAFYASKVVTNSTNDKFFGLVIEDSDSNHIGADANNNHKGDGSGSVKGHNNIEWFSQHPEQYLNDPIDKGNVKIGRMDGDDFVEDRYGNTIRVHVTNDMLVAHDGQLDAHGKWIVLSFKAAYRPSYYDIEKVEKEDAGWLTDDANKQSPSAVAAPFDTLATAYGAENIEKAAFSEEKADENDTSDDGHYFAKVNIDGTEAYFQRNKGGDGKWYRMGVSGGNSTYTPIGGKTLEVGYDNEVDSKGKRFVGHDESKRRLEAAAAIDIHEQNNPNYPVINGDEKHHGTGNQAGYSVKRGATPAVEYKTNIVTVDPQTTSLTVKKVWKANGAEAAWPDGAEVTFGIFKVKDGEETAVKGSVDNSGKFKAGSEDLKITLNGDPAELKVTNLPKLNGVTYKAREIKVNDAATAYNAALVAGIISDTIDYIVKVTEQTINGDKVVTATNSEPAIEKYVNKDVHADLAAFDEEFTYDIMTYVPEGASAIEIEDELKPQLTLLSSKEDIEASAIYKNSNDHTVKSSVDKAEDGKVTATADVNGNKVTLNVADIGTGAGQQNIEGKWVQITLKAKIAESAYDDIIKQLASDDPDAANDSINWAKIVKDEPVKGGNTPHSGLVNEAKYRVYVDNDHSSKWIPSNDVTVKPVTEVYKAQKKWQDGNWPNGAKVKFTLVKISDSNQEEIVQEKSDITTAEVVEFEPVPTLENVRYEVREEVTAMPAGQYSVYQGTEVVDGVTVFTNKTTDKDSNPAKIKLTFDKIIENGTLSDYGAFKFELKRTTPSSTSVYTRENDSNGAVTFEGIDILSFNDEGEYSFTINEDKGDQNVEYDDKTIVINVKVKKTETEGKIDYEIEEVTVDGTAQTIDDAKSTDVEIAAGSFTNKAKFPVKVKKTDLGGKELPGAEIVVKDKNGNTIDSWTSGTTAHEINLLPGDYTMEETVAPEGHQKVDTTIEFTVDTDGKVTLNSATSPTVGAVEYDDATGTITLKDAPEDIPIDETPEIAKYVNKDVHKDIKLDERFRYDILAYVTEDADELTITDTLQGDLVFASIESNVDVYDMGADVDFTPVTGTVDKNGSKINVNGDNIDINGKTLTVTLTDVEKYRGNWLRVTFYAKIDDAVVKEIKSGKKTIDDLKLIDTEVKDNEADTGRAEPNVGNDPVLSDEDHTGIPNDASYKIKVGNDYKYEDKSNTVTVKPETVDVEGSKTWNDAGNKAKERPDSITINLLLVDINNNKEAVTSKTVTAADSWKWSFKDLPTFVDKKYVIEEEAVEHYATEIDGNEVINTYTVPEKYVNNEVTWDFDNFDQQLEYAVMAYVTKDAKSLKISDTLVDALQFVGDDGGAKVYKMGSGYDSNDHKENGSVAETGSEIKDATITVDKQTLTAEITDATPYRDHWIKLTFNAEIKPEAYERVKDLIEARNAGAEWADITDNGLVVTRPAHNSHDGIPNKAKYALETENNGTFEEDTNTVTIEPKTTKLRVKKTWGVLGLGAWPADTTVTFGLYANDEELKGSVDANGKFTAADADDVNATQATVELTTAKHDPVTVTGLPKLEGVKYTAREIKVANLAGAANVTYGDAANTSGNAFIKAIKYIVSMVKGIFKSGDEEIDEFIANNELKVKTQFTKTDLGGTELDGAGMKLTDKDGKVVDTWTSKAGERHELYLEPGEYTLTETVAPEGFVAVTTEMKFVVKEDGTVVLETVKVDNGGEITIEEVGDNNHIILKDAALPPQSEKYVNKDVDVTLDTFDKPFTYDIMAYVSADGTNLTITDELVDALEFVDTDKIAVYDMGEGIDANDHETTVAKDGKDITEDAVITTSGQTLTVKMDKLDEKGLRNHWIKVSFNAQIKASAYDKVAELIKSRDSADEQWADVTDNGLVVNKTPNHDGVPNKAKYTLETSNSGKSEVETNTVTIEPKTTEVKVSKEWILDDEDVQAWPDGASVEVILRAKGDDAEAVSATKADGQKAVLTADASEATFAGLPVVDGVTYFVEEGKVTNGGSYTIGQVQDLGDGVFKITNKTYTPEIEKYVNKKVEDLTDAERDGTVHTDLSAFDEVYTYDIQAYITPDAKYVEVIDELREVLEFVGDGPVAVAVKDGKALDAPKLTAEGEPVSDYNIDSEAWKAGKLVLTMGSDDEDAEVLYESGKWLQITFDARIKAEYKTVEALKAEGVNVWTTIVENDPIDDADVVAEYSDASVDSHEGIVNDSHYNINKIKAVAGVDVDNAYQYSDKSNTVTVRPQVIDIEGSKTWQDADNKAGKRPASITINLLADGSKVDTKTVTADDDWAWNFTALPKYKDGKEIVYTITEDAVAGYTAEVDGYSVTNTYTVPEKYVNNEVTWDFDNFDQKLEYAVMAYVTKDAKSLKVSDTLVDALQFAGADGGAKVYKMGSGYDSNDHKENGTVKGLGEEISEAAITVDKQTLTAEITDATPYRDCWIKLTFNAEIKPEAYERVKDLIEARNAGDEWADITDNGLIVTRPAHYSHDGIPNKAKYTLVTENNGTFEEDTNTVTIEPKDEEPKIEKYVNKKTDDLADAERDGTVHTDLSAFDEVYTYDIQAYITADAKYVEVIDELRKVLEFVGDGPTSVVVKEGTAKNAPKLTAAGETVESYEIDKDAWAAGKLVLTMGTDAEDAKALYPNGKWLQITFDARIKKQYKSLEAIKAAGADVWSKVTVNEEIDDADVVEEFSKAVVDNHEGIVNDSSYRIKSTVAGLNVDNGFAYGVKSNSVTVQPKTTEVSFSKKALGGDEIEGAELQLLDEDGFVIDEWTSTKEDHVIHLVDGEYTLIENVAPEGYKCVTTAMKFVVKDDKVELLTAEVDNGGKLTVMEGNKIVLEDAPNDVRGIVEITPPDDKKPDGVRGVVQIDEEEKETPEVRGAKKIDRVDTGDDATMFIWTLILILSMSAIAIGTILRRRSAR